MNNFVYGSFGKALQISRNFHIENGWGEGRFPNHLEPCMQSTEAWESTVCSEKTGFPWSWNLEWIYVGVGRKCGKMQEKTDEIENKVLR